MFPFQLLICNGAVCILSARAVHPDFEFPAFSSMVMLGVGCCSIPRLRRHAPTRAWKIAVMELTLFFHTLPSPQYP